MQEGYNDYYEMHSIEYPEVRGCCLCCPDSEPDCLCFDCKCKKCYWYDSYEENDGVCELKYEFKAANNSYSNKQLKNVTKQTNKAYYGQIENSHLMWIPKSVVNSKGYVKNWFVKNLDIW